MKWLILTVCCIAFIELFLCLRTQKCIESIAALSLKISRVLRSSAISDHWKEKVMLTYAGRMFSYSMRLLAILVIAFSPFVVASLLADYYGLQLAGLLASWQGILVCTAIAVVYSLVRKRIVRV